VARVAKKSSGTSSGRRQAFTDASVTEAMESVAARRKWESSPQGQSRMQELQPGGAVSKAQHYAVHGWGAATSPHEPSTTQEPHPQLPGMEHTPEKAFVPPQWEDLHPDERAHALGKLAQHAGSTLDTMKRSFGAQVDQAYLRGEKHGTTHPYAEQFYSPGSEEHQVLARSAKEMGMPLEHYQLMHAATSPQSTFKQETQSGKVSYPNDELARAAVEQGKEGVSYGKEPVENPEPRKKNLISFSDVGGRGKGIAKNARAATRLYHRLRGGTLLGPKESLADVSGDYQAANVGPKTGPYTNAWSGHPDQFFVADRHSGLGGMLPHLSQDGAEKAVKNIPHFHSMADFAARQALSERGVSSIRQGQAAQWGEQKIYSGEQTRNRKAVSEHIAYPESGKHLNAQQFEKAGQGQMFKPAGAQVSLSGQTPQSDRRSAPTERVSSTAIPRGHAEPNSWAPGSTWDF
jgi:hypothetical protein